MTIVIKHAGNVRCAKSGTTGPRVFASPEPTLIGKRKSASVPHPRLRLQLVKPRYANLAPNASNAAIPHFPFVSASPDTSGTTNSNAWNRPILPHLSPILLCIPPKDTPSLEEAKEATTFKQATVEDHGQTITHDLIFFQIFFVSFWHYFPHFNEWEIHFQILRYRKSNCFHETKNILWLATWKFVGKIPLSCKFLGHSGPIGPSWPKNWHSRWKFSSLIFRRSRSIKNLIVFARTYTEWEGYGDSLRLNLYVFKKSLPCSTRCKKYKIL